MINNPEQLRVVEMEGREKCIDWLYTQLEDNGGVSVPEEYIEQALDAYLEGTGKSILELGENDKENILQMFCKNIWMKWKMNKLQKFFCSIILYSFGI